MLRVINNAATIALAFSVLFFVTRLVFLVQRRLLWRVRRKLILSYIFIGVVPTLLILGFVVLSGWFIAGTVGAYLFRDGYDEVMEKVRLLGDAAALEIGRSPQTTEETVNRVQQQRLAVDAVSDALDGLRPGRARWPAAGVARLVGAPSPSRELARRRPRPRADGSRVGAQAGRRLRRSDTADERRRHARAPSWSSAP